MTTVVVSLGSAAAAIPPAVLALPFSQTPVSDVIALLAATMTAVGESAAAAARLPAGFAALLGVDLTGVNPVLIGGSAVSGVGLVTVGNSAVAGPQTASPLLPVTPAQPVGHDGDDRSGFGVFIPTALMASTAPPQTAPASLSAGAGEHQSFIDQAISALLLPLSLWALFTGALPGLAGLLVVFSAGIRAGYRQAKAGIAVKVAGIARFAGPGPLGVVRSGSLVVLHQRGVVADNPRAPRLSRLGDQAA